MIRPGTNLDGPLSPEDFEAFERYRLDHPLPDDYRQFLRTYNGGEPESPVFVLPSGKSELIHYLQGLGLDEGLYQARLHQGPRCNLEHAIRNWADKHPSLNQVIPIGSNRYGGIICLGLAGKFLGKIYFWPPGPPRGTEDTLHLVTPSFTAFMAGL